MSALARRLAAAFFIAHGVAHLVGFVAAWQLSELKDAPYTTVILNGALDVGDAGMRVMGVLWIAAAAAFAGAAVAVIRGSYRVVAAVALFSLIVCGLGLPRAIAGVAIDVVILAVLAGLAIARPAALRPAVR
jgi:hypothetical protein